MFPEFIYENYEYDVRQDGLHIMFVFKLNGLNNNIIEFSPSAFIPNRPFLSFKQPKECLDNLVFHIGMVELISYWKSVCPPIVKVLCGTLDTEQIAFWKKLYFNGLGEFFYTNSIKTTLDDFMSIESNGPIYSPMHNELSNDYLVPIGGGKDSAVTLELLSNAGFANRPIPLIMNPRGATIGTIEAAGYSMDDVAVIKRTIHPKLLELNSNGCLNGHTPFSAMLGFYTLLICQLSGRRNVALSNECSASESTVIGTNINHQYSKSLEFENDFRGYVQAYLSSDYNYFSLLRPIYELEIANLFAHRCQSYWDVFKSCNVGSKLDVWCGHCAKCLFVYIMLAPLMEDPERLVEIFGHDLLDDASLQLEFDQLIGKAETKPFECVGTVEEANAALSMLIERRGWHQDEQRPILLKGYQPMPYSMSLFECHEGHNLNERELNLLTTAVRESLPSGIPTNRLRALLGGKRILIAGYGREGKSSEALIRRILPVQTYDVAQNNEEIKMALSTKQYDLILKSPGIPSFFFDGLCDKASITSQTDLFLQVFARQTIGVTGTKGKTTTTNLVAHLLREGGKEVVMAGNMGIPLFDIVDQISEKSWVVCEFSCHQLENIHTSPHIALVLNLFQEHLDHYRDYLDYQMAKMQIALHQSHDDHFFYCSDNADLSMRVVENKEKILSEIHAFSLDDARAGRWSACSSQLKGEHNLGNIHAAAEMASLVGVSYEELAAGIALFKGLEHRLELVGTFEGVTYYNDSISTIPEACIAALKALEKVDTLILGGFDRGIDYSVLADYLVSRDCTVRKLAFVGEAGKRISAALGENTDRFAVIYENDYHKIVYWCKSVTSKGKICLLSPAAASYDSFKNFEERGRHFKKLVSGHE